MRHDYCAYRFLPALVRAKAVATASRVPGVIAQLSKYQILIGTCHNERDFGPSSAGGKTSITLEIFAPFVTLPSPVMLT